MSAIIFEDQFDVKDIDKDGKKFEKVSRIHGMSESYEMEIILDVNVDIYPIEVNTKIYVALSTSLNLDGTPDEGHYDPHALSKPGTELEKFEYIMYGKVFKCVEEKSPSLKLAVYVSFGGLLMMLKGDPRNLQGIELDARIYLLMRKVY